MTASYKILFSIELLHTYYGNGKCLDFAIIPSAATEKLFQNNQLVYRMQEHELWVLIKTNADGQPFVPLSPDQKFVFYLQLVQPQLLTVTNLDAEAFTNSRFYFSNLTSNQAGANLHLTQPIPAYNLLVHYYPGMFAAGAGNEIYECIKENPAGAGVSRNTTDEAFWMSRGDQPFVSRSDMVSFAPSTMRLQVAEAAQYRVRAFALNKANNRTYNIAMPIAKENPVSVGEAPAAGFREVQADFSALPPGRYKVQVNEQEKEVYVDDAGPGYFGVVEVFNHLGGMHPFALLDAQGKVKDTIISGRPNWQRYTLRFANRLAYLKYISLNRGVQTITDGRSAAQRQFSFAANPVPSPLPPPPPNATLFLSNKPVPLQQQLDIFNLSMPAVFGTGTLKAPNPNPMLPGVLSRYEQDYYCTVMLNY